MYKIYVENIRCYSYHGCLEEETVIGSNYVVDVVVDLKNPRLSGNDDLNETIDYCDVTDIVKDVMTGPFRYVKDGVEVEEEMLSGVLIEHKGCNVRVGSGFSIDQRKHLFLNYFPLLLQSD